MAVQPEKWTRRVAILVNNNTYDRRSEIVSSRRGFGTGGNDESGIFWDSESEFWDSSGTVFAREAKHGDKRKTAVKSRFFRVGA